MKRSITKGIALILIMAFLFFTSGCQGGAATASNVSEAVSSESEASPAAESEVAESSVAAVSEPESEPEPEPEPEVNNDWEIDSPENHGMDAELLSQLHAALPQADFIRSMVTVKNGYLVDEYYQEGYDETSVFRLHSCSKSFTGALIGIAIDQGLISGVDAKLAEFLPQVEASDSDWQKQVTLEHLLTHSSGIEWYEWGGNSSSWRPFQSAENWVDYILGNRMVAEPGTYFAYSTGGSHLLAAALQEATGKSAYEFGVEHIFAPLGMDSVEWSADPQGIPSVLRGPFLRSTLNRDALQADQFHEQLKGMRIPQTSGLLMEKKPVGIIMVRIRPCIRSVTHCFRIVIRPSNYPIMNSQLLFIICHIAGDNGIQNIDAGVQNFFVLFG